MANPKMRIRRTTLKDCEHETDTVIVIDVLRAFTTSAYAFSQGVFEIALASSVEDAFRLKEVFPGALILGEVDGYPVDGFDLGNSPSALNRYDLSGRRLIQRTTTGTQGVIRSKNARYILTTGLCTVDSTLRKLHSINPCSLTMVQTGVFDGGWGDEDVACADLLEARILGEEIDLEQIKHRVIESKSGRHFEDPDHEVFPVADLEAALAIDRFEFSMQVHKENGELFLRPEPVGNAAG